MWSLITAIFGVMLDVAQFWKQVSRPSILALERSAASRAPAGVGLGLTKSSQKFLSWWNSKSPRSQLFHTLETATSYEQWESAAFDLDELLNKDLWYEGHSYNLVTFPANLPTTGAKTISVDIMTTD